MLHRIISLIPLGSMVITWFFVGSLIAAVTPPFDPGEMAAGAPPELMHWGKMVGQWSTIEESLQRDGSGWEPSTGADWDFFWAFDGWGIQDNYTSPPDSVEMENESKRQRGINLRIYSTSGKKWVLTWLATQSSEPVTLTAFSDDEKMVMLTDRKNPQGKFGRITFFDITEDHFEWKLEWSDDQVQWLEVHRIHGTRRR